MSCLSLTLHTRKGKKKFSLPQWKIEITIYCLITGRLWNFFQNEFTEGTQDPFWSVNLMSEAREVYRPKWFNFQALNHLFNNENVSIGIYNKYFRCLRRGNFVIRETLVLEE